ncbi:MAG: flavoprotein [Verrucomicrobiota bacterium]
MSVERPVVIVGVTGSIAAYKAADLVSKLVKRDCEVHVVMTHGAQEFVTPLTFQTLSRNPVVSSVFEGTREWKPAHIALADRAALLLIAPATANILAELAHGLAGNPLTEIALATCGCMQPPSTMSACCAPGERSSSAPKKACWRAVMKESAASGASTKSSTARCKLSEKTTRKCSRRKPRRLASHTPQSKWLLLFCMGRQCANPLQCSIGSRRLGFRRAQSQAM